MAGKKVTDVTPDMIPQRRSGIPETYQDPRRALERADFEAMNQARGNVANLAEKSFIRALKGY